MFSIKAKREKRAKWSKERIRKRRKRRMGINKTRSNQNIWDAISLNFRRGKTEARRTEEEKEEERK